MSREEAIAKLATIRDIARKMPGDQVVSGPLLRAVLPILAEIEAQTPESELWQRGLVESELTTDTRVGEHLAVTRKMFGLVP